MRTCLSRAVLLSLLCVMTSATFVAAARAQTLLRTSQMWGTEKAESKLTGAVGIAGECVQSGADLTCQFVSLSFDNEGKCTAMASTWTEHLKLVSRTKEEVRWGGTKGPTGLSGAMTTTILVAKRGSLANEQTDFFNEPGYGPGAFDAWSYQATQVFTAPVMGKRMPPITTEVISGGETRSAFCRPTRALLFATSPD